MLHKETSKPSQPSRLYHVLYIGVSFMVLFSAYSIFESMISHVYKEMGFTNLGRICIFTLSVTFGTGSIFAPHFNRKITPKMGLAGGSVTYVTFVLTGTLTAYCHKNNLEEMLCSDFSLYFLNLLFAATIGLGASILWLAQLKYVNDCTNETNKGTYHGIFMALMQFSTFIGSTIAAFVLRHADEFTFFIILTCLAILSSVLFLFLPQIDEQQQPESLNHQESIGEAAKKFFDCYKNPAHYPVITSFFSSGLIIAFYATYLPTVVKETVLEEPANVINQLISFTFMGLGIGQTIASYYVGRAIDRFPNYRIRDLIFGNIELALVLSFIAMEAQSLGLALFAGFIWGTADNGVKTLGIGLVSSKFNGKLELFAAYRGTQSFGILFGSLCTIFFGDNAGSIFVLGILALQICCHVMFNMTYANMDKKDLGTELLERGYSQIKSKV